MNCPKCGKKMEEESMKPEVIDWPAGVNCYNPVTKDSFAPKEILVQYVKGYWCRETTCNMKDRYTYHDGNHKYFLGTHILERVEELLK